MNNKTPYRLMPKDTILLLSAPITKVEVLTSNLANQLITIKLIRHKVATLENQLANWRDRLTKCKHKYISSDRALAMIDGRYQKIEKTKKAKKTKKELKQFNADQLAQIAIALEKIMEDKEKEKNNGNYTRE